MESDAASLPEQARQPAWYGYATFESRAAAALIDGLIVSAAQLIIALVAVLIGVLVGAATGSDVAGIVTGLLLGIPAYVAILIAYILMDGRPYGQTPGKNIMGIKVIDRSGQPIGRGLAVGRYFAEVVSAMTFYIGYLMVLWDHQNRALHDMITTTWVVKSGPDKPALGDVVRAPFSRG